MYLHSCQRSILVFFTFILWCKASGFEERNVDPATSIGSEVTTTASATISSVTAEITCFPKDWFPDEPILSDCLVAASLFKGDRFYDLSIAYQKQTVPQLIARQVPVLWRHESCGVFLDADPSSGVDIFSLSTAWPALSLTIKECIITKKPGHKHGGYVAVGNDRGFYVAIGGQANKPTTNSSSGDSQWNFPKAGFGRYELQAPNITETD